jgi:hypothetical protein
MAFVHHTMLTAENLRGLTRKTTLFTTFESGPGQSWWGGGAGRCGRCLFGACDWPDSFLPTIRISSLFAYTAPPRGIY